MSSKERLYDAGRRIAETIGEKYQKLRFSFGRFHPEEAAAYDVYCRKRGIDPSSND